MFPDIDAIVAHPAALPRAFRAAVAKMSLLELQIEEYSSQQHLISQQLVAAHNHLSDSNQRVLAQLQQSMTSLRHTHSASAPASQPHASKPDTVTPNHHLVADRIRGSGRTSAM